MWWSPDDGDGVCLMMMQLGDALMIPYVFTSLHWCMWLDPMPYDALEPWVSLMMEVWWLLDEFRPCWWWHDKLMEMTYLALMTWYIDGDDIPCLDDMMEMTYRMPWLLMRIPYPFLNPSSTLNPSLHLTLPLNPSYILTLYITLPKPLPKHHFLTTLPYPLAYTLLYPNAIPLPFIKPLHYPNAIPLPSIKPLLLPNATLSLTFNLASYLR